MSSGRATAGLFRRLAPADPARAGSAASGGWRLTFHLRDELAQLLTVLRAADYRFVTPTPATIARVNGRAGNRVAADLVGALGWSRPFEADMLPGAVLDALDRAGCLAREAGLLRSTVRVSSLGPDLFLHSAYPTVAADAVFFGPDTYRFVSAVERELARLPGPVERAVDIGCGAGPGGVAVAHARPGAAVTLGDVNPKALAFAEANARAAGLARIDVVESDLLHAVEGSFDLIVSNPPYLNDPLARAYRHGGGAFGEALSVRIVRTALDRLAVGGSLILYTGVAIVAGHDPFLDAVAPDLARSGAAWTYREIDPDVFGEELETENYRSVDRIAAVVLTVTRRS